MLRHTLVCVLLRQRNIIHVLNTNLGGGVFPLPFLFILMTKFYKANTHIALNVILPNGKNIHVSFMGHSDGSSSFSTDNEELQQSLEKHYRFNQLFFLDREVKEAHTEKDTVKNMVQQKAEYRQVEVSDLADAKNYIADNFEVSRTLLRSKTSIVEYGRLHGVEFVGI